MWIDAKSVATSVVSRSCLLTAQLASFIRSDAEAARILCYPPGPRLSGDAPELFDKAIGAVIPIAALSGLAA